MGAVSQVLAGSGISDGRITPAGLRWLMERLLPARRRRRSASPWPACETTGVPVIGGGLAILYTLAANFGIEELRPTRGALRQGVIFDLAARDAAERIAAASGEDIREVSVRELQRRFMVDVAQATRVAGVAAALLGGVQPKPNAVEARRELQLGRPRRGCT